MRETCFFRNRLHSSVKENINYKHHLRCPGENSWTRGQKSGDLGERTEKTYARNLLYAISDFLFKVFWYAKQLAPRLITTCLLVRHITSDVDFSGNNVVYVTSLLIKSFRDICTLYIAAGRQKQEL